MIKIDDIYSISENNYGFVLNKLNSTGKSLKTLGYFHGIDGALNEYVRQKTMQAVLDDETETTLKEVLEEMRVARNTIESLMQ